MTSNLNDTWKKAAEATTSVLTPTDSTAKISFEELLEQSKNSDNPVLIYMHDPESFTSKNFKPYLEWKAAKEGIDLVTFDMNDVPSKHQQTRAYLTGVDCGKVMPGTYPTSAPILPDKVTDEEKHRLYEQHENFMQRDTSSFIDRVKNQGECQPELIGSLSVNGANA